MTLYTYSCKKCGQFSEFRESNDREICDCGNPVRKIYGGAFALHGNGFYSNDSVRDARLQSNS